jgi:hypothetical protein
MAIFEGAAKSGATGRLASERLIWIWKTNSLNGFGNYSAVNPGESPRSAHRRASAIMSRLPNIRKQKPCIHVLFNILFTYIIYC